MSKLHWSPGIHITLVPRCPYYTGPKASILHWSQGVHITLVPRRPYYTGPKVSMLHWSPGIHITLVPRCPYYTDPKASILHWSQGVHITLVPRRPYYTGPKASILHWSQGVHITLVPRCPYYTGYYCGTNSLITCVKIFHILSSLNDLFFSFRELQYCNKDAPSINSIMMYRLLAAVYYHSYQLTEVAATPTFSEHFIIVDDVGMI